MWSYPFPKYHRGARWNNAIIKYPKFSNASKNWTKKKQNANNLSCYMNPSRVRANVYSRTHGQTTYRLHEGISMADMAFTCVAVDVKFELLLLDRGCWSYKVEDSLC